MPAGEKTEKPTPQRLRKAREQGQFLVSRGALNAIQFVVALMLLGRVVTGWQHTLSRSLPELLSAAFTHEISDAEWPVLLHNLLLQNVTPLLYFCGALLAVTLAAHLGISRFGFSLQRLTPNLNRLSPLGKLKELPGQNTKAVVEAIVLLVILGFLLRGMLSENGTALLQLALTPAPSAAAQVGSLIESLLWKAAALFVIFGAFDFVRAQRKYIGQLRMTKQEIKEENRRQDGDPQLKARIRRLRRELARKRMIQDVHKATAVIVNPTHFAVAIRYEMETMASPEVVAKGKNWLALRIRRIAVENQIPVIENPPLARALYDVVEVGRTISPEFYKAIAEVLAYVYRIMGRGVRTS